jgi:hypothetical protein
MGHSQHTTAMRWTLMDTGHKNGNPSGNRPAPMHPAFLLAQGWASEIPIVDYTLATSLVYNESATTPNDYYSFDVGSLVGTTRRYIIENKQKGNNFDEGLPHAVENKPGGLLIWDVKNTGLDPNQTSIIPADGNNTNTVGGQSDDLFRPDLYNKITDLTTPANLKIDGTTILFFTIESLYFSFCFE